MVGDVEFEIARTVFIGRGHLDPLSGDFPTQLRRLAQRDTVRGAAPDVPDAPGVIVYVRDLVQHQVAKIVNMEKIADLLAAAAEADVLEATVKTVRRQPECDHALLGLGHLPRTGQQAAPIDRMANAVRVA